MARAKKTLADLQELVTGDDTVVPVENDEGDEGDANDQGGQFEFLPVSRNVKTVDEMLARIDELAGLDAAGQDALPNLGLEIARWAAMGLIKAKAPGKKDADQSDAVREAYLRYSETRRDKLANKNVVQSKRSIDANVSKLRIFAKIGERQDIDAENFLFDVTQTRNALDAAGLATKGAYIAMQDAAKKVVGKRELTEEELRAAILKPAAKPRTALSVYKAILSNVETLIEENLDNAPDVHRLRDEIATKVAFHDQLAKFLSLASNADPSKFGYRLVKLESEPTESEE
jgi:hypothetical protein